MSVCVCAGKWQHGRLLLTRAPLKPGRKLRVSDIFWLNIPAIKKIILSYRSSSIKVWDICIYKYNDVEMDRLQPSKMAL
jgi:hypothetical protein